MRSSPSPAATARGTCTGGANSADPGSLSRRRCTMRKRRSARRTEAAILRLAGLEDPDRRSGGIAQDAEDAVRDLDALPHDLRAEIARPPRALRAIVDADVGQPPRDSLE